MIIVPPGEAILRWFGHLGRTYFLQAADPNTPLESWIWTDSIEAGNNEDITYEAGSTAGTAFFRLLYTDQLPPLGVSLDDWDADNDGLSNAEELYLQTNPLVADTSGDGIPDGWAVAHGLQPLDHNASLWFRDTDSTNLQAFEAGVQAHPGATLSDWDGDSVPNDRDADPRDVDVDWEPAAANRYILVEVNPPADSGSPLDFNDECEALFDKGLWSAGTWAELPTPDEEGEAVIPGSQYNPHTFYTTDHEWSHLHNCGLVAGSQFFTLGAPGDFEHLPHIITLSPGSQLASSTQVGTGWADTIGYKTLSPLGIDSTERIFAYKLRSEIEGAGTAHASLLILNPALETIGTLPFDSSHWIPHAEVSASGVLLAQTRPFGWGGPYPLKLWDANGQVKPTPLQSSVSEYMHTLSIAEVSGGKVLATSQSLTTARVASMNPNEDMKLIRSLTGKDIQMFAGDGTAMTYDGTLWRNGEFIPMRELSQQWNDLDQDRWTMNPIKANAHGAYLISAKDPDWVINRFFIALPVEVVSRDAFLAGSIRIPEGFEDLEIEFINEETGENLGRYDGLMGSGSTFIHENDHSILASEPAPGEDRQVWFVKHPDDPRKVEFHMCFESVGNVTVRLYKADQFLGASVHELTTEADFAAVIQQAAAWVDGSAFQLGGTSSGGGVAAPPAQSPPVVQSHHPYVAAIISPVFSILAPVEGLTIAATGLYDGVAAGLRDDWEFLQFLGAGVVMTGDWLVETAMAEIQKHQTNPRYAAQAFKQLAEEMAKHWELEPLENLRSDLASWDGFKHRARTAFAFAWELRFFPQLNPNLLISRPTAAALLGVIVDSMADWGDDFVGRMTTGGDKAAYLETPWEKGSLLDSVHQIGHTATYTFGYTFGYLGEQVAIGAITAGSTKIVQVMVKGGPILANTLARRTAAVVAVRAHWLKKVLADSSLGDDVLRAMYDRGMVMFSVDPSTPAIKSTAAEVMETALRRQNFDDALFNHKTWLDAITAPNSNLRKLATTSGGEAILKKRCAQLFHLLSDDADDITMKNFLKVAEERLVFEKPGGAIDEWMEDFLRAFKGNASEYVNRPSLDDLSPNGIHRIKNFLSDPNPGYAWKFEEGVETNWKAPIVRGLLVELDLWHRIYKLAGWEHLPIEEAVDFVRGIQALQVKSIGTVNPNRITKMKDAVLALRNYGVNNGKTELILDIRRRPGLDTSQLKQELDDYIVDLNPSANGLSITVNYSDYDFIPNL